MIQAIYPANKNYNQYTNSKNINFKAIRLVNISPKFSPIEKDILSETTKFTEQGIGAKLLGHGVFSEVFELIKLSGIVLKRSFKEDMFEQEKNAMISLPDSLPNSQHFVARLWDDETYKYYLLSTKVAGASPNPEDNKWNSQSLKNLFDGMLEMDKAGIYHGDLNNGNIKLTPDGEVNFIDFQWGTRTNSADFFKENPIQCMPNFILIQNSQMLEMAEIPYYIRKINNEKDGKFFLKNYLQEKSKYHKKRADFIKELNNDILFTNDIQHMDKACRFETAQSRMFQTADEDIIKLEAKKIQFLSSFREASKYLDANTPHKNIITAPSAYLVTISNLQNLRREIVAQKNNACPNTFKEDYLNGLQEYADYWFKNLSEWAENAFYYPFRHVQCKLLPWESLHNFEDPAIKLEKMDPMWNILKHIDKSYEPKYNAKFFIQNNLAINKLTTISNFMKLSTDTMNCKAIETYNKMLNTFAKLQNAHNAEKALDVINLSLLLSRRAYKMQFQTQNYSNIQYCKAICTQSAELAETYFFDILKDIKNCEPTYYRYVGYPNMGDFTSA